MKKIALHLSWIWVFTFVCENLHGQVSTDSVSVKYKKSYWMDMGFGWGGEGNAFNIAASYEIIPRRFMSFRYAEVSAKDHCEEVAFLIPIYNPMGKSAQSYEVSFGFLKKGRHSMFTMAAGICYVQTEVAGGNGAPGGGIPIIYYSSCPADYHVEKENAVGISLMAQFIPCLRWGGIGIAPYVNINTERIYGSFTINAAFGRLRPKKV